MATYTDNYALIKPSLADVADIAAINQNTDKIDQIMHGSQTSLADAYDPAETYNLRDKVMHDFQLYTCLANGTTGTWDPTKWERANAADTGGNYVDVTENYQAGLNIAVIDIDGDQHSIYVPEMTAATAQEPGTPGLVPPPTPADSGKYLDSSGNWSTPSGGGGGETTVIPNPQGTPTDTLNTIQIGQTIFDIPGSGGESGGGKFIITNLWNYTDDNSGVVPYNTFGPFTLRESITNYDAVFLELISDSGDLSNQWRGSAFTPLYFINALQSEYEPYNINFTSYDQRSSHYVITGNTIQCTIGSGGSLNGLVNVWGVKFGGSGGAMESVLATPVIIGSNIDIAVSDISDADLLIFDFGILTGDNKKAHLIGQMTLEALEDTTGYKFVGEFVSSYNISFGLSKTSDTLLHIVDFYENGWSDTVYMWNIYKVKYGGGPGSSEEISDMTWTELVSTTGTSTAVAIPQGTKRLVLTAELNGIVTKVAEEKIENIQKLLDVSLQSTWNMGAEYADTSGNHTNIAMSVNNGLVTARSGYNTVTAKVYALS